MENPKRLSSLGDVLPETAVTKDGVQFNPRQMKWRLSSLTQSRTLDFTNHQHVMSERILIAFKRTLIWYLENQSTNTAYSRFDEMTAFIRFVVGERSSEKVSSLSSSDFLNYKSSLSQERQYVLSSIATYIRRWHSLKEFGMESDLVQLLDEMRLKGIVKGKAVSMMCPIKGPFTEIEIIALQQALNNSFANGGVSLRVFALFWVIQALGARPIQIASMKIMDFKAKHLSDGSLYFSIDVPRAKQRDTLNRDEFKKRKLVQQVGELLQKYIEQLRSELVGRFPILDCAPLFPRKRNASFPEIPGFEGHANSDILSSELSRAFRHLNVISERTGETISINPYRFRYTLGTRAAEQGASELVIAELLDHSDTQQVGVYVAATPQMVERIDRAMAMQIAPLAQAFAGVIINSEQEAVRSDDPNSRIVDPQLSMSLSPVGNCGKYGYCGLRAPVSCYTCPSFQPWLDGPHEEMLSHLLRERERLMEEYGAKIASVNDRAIFAVAEVIQEVESHRQLKPE